MLDLLILFFLTYIIPIATYKQHPECCSVFISIKHYHTHQQSYKQLQSGHKSRFTYTTELNYWCLICIVLSIVVLVVLLASLSLSLVTKRVLFLSELQTLRFISSSSENCFLHVKTLIFQQNAFSEIFDFFNLNVYKLQI